MMAGEKLILALGKVIIAAAWADGQIAHDEMNSLKDLLFQLPGMTANQWALLEMYIDSPVEEAERARLVAELQDAISSSADRDLALNALHDMIQADGVITDEERRVAAQIREAIETADVSVIASLSRLMRGPVARRSEAVASAPNREIHYEDFIRNRVYYTLRRRLDLGEAELDIPEATLRKMALAGGLMARIAHADSAVTDDEVATMEEILQRRWGVSREEAALVAQTAVDDMSKDLDYYRLSRGFFESAPQEAERLAFVDVLFEVAAADGMATHDEIEEIRLIASSLKLTHRQFIEGKLKIPRGKRAS